MNYWRAIELFAVQQISKNKNQKIQEFSDPRQKKLPWEKAAAISPETEFINKHEVYVGLYIRPVA